MSVKKTCSINRGFLTKSWTQTTNDSNSGWSPTTKSKLIVDLQGPCIKCRELECLRQTKMTVGNKHLWKLRNYHVQVLKTPEFILLDQPRRCVHQSASWWIGDWDGIAHARMSRHWSCNSRHWSFLPSMLDQAIHQLSKKIKDTVVDVPNVYLKKKTANALTKLRPGSCNGSGEILQEDRQVLHRIRFLA